MSLDLVAIAVAREGCADEVRTACASIIEDCRRERGALDVRFFAQVDDPRSFAFFERWATPADFEAHGGSPHVLRLQTALEGKLEAPMTVHLYERAGDPVGADPEVAK